MSQGAATRRVVPPEIQTGGNQGGGGHAVTAAGQHDALHALPLPLAAVFGLRPGASAGQAVALEIRAVGAHAQVGGHQGVPAFAVGLPGSADPAGRGRH